MSEEPSQENHESEKRNPFLKRVAWIGALALVAIFVDFKVGGTLSGQATGQSAGGCGGDAYDQELAIGGAGQGGDALSASQKAEQEAKKAKGQVEQEQDDEWNDEAAAKEKNQGGEGGGNDDDEGPRHRPEPELYPSQEEIVTEASRLVYWWDAGVEQGRLMMNDDAYGHTVGWFNRE